MTKNILLYINAQTTHNIINPDHVIRAAATFEDAATGATISELAFWLMSDGGDLPCEPGAHEEHFREKNPGLVSAWVGNQGGGKFKLTPRAFASGVHEIAQTIAAQGKTLWLCTNVQSLLPLWFHSPLREYLFALCPERFLPAQERASQLGVELPALVPDAVAAVNRTRQIVRQLRRYDRGHPLWKEDLNN